MDRSTPNAKEKTYQPYYNNTANREQIRESRFHLHPSRMQLGGALSRLAQWSWISYCLGRIECVRRENSVNLCPEFFELLDRLNVECCHGEINPGSPPSVLIAAKRCSTPDPTSHPEEE